MASFQQSFNEMGRGERFVQDHLRATARARERWYVGLPAIMVSGLYLTWFIGRVRKARQSESMKAV